MSALTESDTVNEFKLIFNTNVCTHGIRQLMNFNLYLIRMSALTESDTVKEFKLIFNTNVCTH